MTDLVFEEGACEFLDVGGEQHVSADDLVEVRQAGVHYLHQADGVVALQTHKLQHQRRVQAVGGRGHALVDQFRSLEGQEIEKRCHFVFLEAYALCAPLTTIETPYKTNHILPERNVTWLSFFQSERMGLSSEDQTARSNRSLLVSLLITTFSCEMTRLLTVR